MNRNTETNPDFIPFARPSIGIEEEEAVLKVLRSGWLTTGEEAFRFEAEFAEALPVPYASVVAVLDLARGKLRHRRTASCAERAGHR